MPRIRAQSACLTAVVYIGEGPAPEGTEDLRALMDSARLVAETGRREHDLAGILYTGGTTGKPNGVMLSHANLYISALSKIIPARRRERIVGLHAAPFFHVAGIGLIVQLSIRGGTRVILPRFEPSAVIQAIEREAVEETFLVPTMLRAVLDHPTFDQHDTSACAA